MKALGIVVVISSSVATAACSKPNPHFCCLTLEDCDQFGVDQVRECLGDQVCVSNECVPAPDASLIDGSLPDAGPDPACVAAGGRIVFVTNRDGDNEIARMNADGSGFQVLTSNSWDDRQAVRSADGALVAWVATPSGTPEIDVMGVDGSDPHSVSQGDGSNPVWSPLGETLAFGTSRDATPQVYAVEASGSGLRNLTQDPATSSSNPYWSPDGTKIVFVRDGGISTMNQDGTAQMEIRDTGGVPKWSPAGLHIAFLHSGLALTTPLGGGEQSLSSDNRVDDFDWAPDSSQLVFELRLAISGADIFTVALDNPTPVPLTTSGTEFTPRWSPDGSRIAFSSRRDGNFEIYVMSADGSSPMNLTNDPGSDQSPIWAPCP